jgi:predicted RNase H-like HicB family nuclease
VNARSHPVAGIAKRLSFESLERLGAMKYKIALRKSEEGFSVSVPGLPGCWSQGATEAEALQNIRDAIKEYLATVEDQLEGATVREIEVQA